MCSFIGVGYLGLFGLWLMEGSWSVQGCSLRCVGKEEAAEQKKQEERSLSGFWGDGRVRRWLLGGHKKERPVMYLCSGTSPAVPVSKDLLEAGEYAPL